MGKPGGSNVPSSVNESIVHEKGTRGTETSKYPEEKKENSILQVAASERGRAQTMVRAPWGSDCIIDSMILAEWFWESQPERVKAPYTKTEQTEQDPEYRGTRETLREVRGTTP